MAAVARQNRWVQRRPPRGPHRRGSCHQGLRRPRRGPTLATALVAPKWLDLARGLTVAMGPGCYRLLGVGQGPTAFALRRRRRRRTRAGRTIQRQTRAASTRSASLRPIVRRECVWLVSESPCWPRIVCGVTTTCRCVRHGCDRARGARRPNIARRPNPPRRLRPGHVHASRWGRAL